MSIFTDTMIEAVRKYRAMLRKYLPQAERINHLHRLNLKNPQLYGNEIMLFDLGHKIIEHLQELDKTKNGYYSYSGISQFACHLKKFLDKYKVDGTNDRVIHTSQLASRHMVKATQLLAIAAESDVPMRDIEACNEMIASYASDEQIELYRSTLQNMTRKHTHDRGGFYRQTLSHFSHCLGEKDARGAVA